MVGPKVARSKFGGVGHTLPGLETDQITRLKAMSLRARRKAARLDKQSLYSFFSTR